MASGHEEILSRLNPGSPETELTPSATGDRLTPSDAVQALSLVSDRIGALLLVIRVADQWRQWYTELADLVCADVLGKAREEGWRVMPPDTLPGRLRHLVQTAIFEHCVPKPCRNCGGRGKIYPQDGPVRDCEKCGGFGRANMTERERAREIGLWSSAWQRYWSARYAWIQRMLVEHERVAVDQLRHALKRG